MESMYFRRFAATLAVALCWTTSNAQGFPRQPAVQAEALPQRVLPTWFEVRGGAWQVPPELVREMAQRLQEGSAHADLHKMAMYRRPLVQLSDYTVQYRGELSGGTRLVQVLGDCHGHNSSDEMLTEAFHVIMDGGTCIFDATYSPKENRFTSFEFHGVG
jgi:hypothetical protein